MTSLVLAYTPLALFVVSLAHLQLVQAVVLTRFATRLANHSSSVASGSTSSTASSTASTAGSTGPVDVLMIPSGTGVIVFPLTIDLKAGLPSSFLLKRCDA